MVENIHTLTIRGILNQMAVGAGRLANFMLHVIIVLTIIMLFWLLFTSGLIPKIDIRTVKHAGDLIKPVARIWM
jgi:hypothetical protein